jgi:hypothetical protein
MRLLIALVVVLLMQDEARSADEGNNRIEIGAAVIDMHGSLLRSKVEREVISFDEEVPPGLRVEYYKMKGMDSDTYLCVTISSKEDMVKDMELIFFPKIRMNKASDVVRKISRIDLHEGGGFTARFKVE